MLALIVAAIGAGLFTYLRDIIRWLIRRHRATAPEVVEQQKVHEAVRQADESLLVVVRSRDQLEADNKRLRDERTAEAVRHAEERAAWLAERSELRQEIEDMEHRWRGALDDLARLRARHGFTDESKPPA